MRPIFRNCRVRQHDQTDCGPACLVSIAACYGLTVSLTRVRQKAATDLQGTCVRGLLDAAAMIGLEAKAVRARHDQLTALPLPAILHLHLENGLQHYVTLYGAGVRSVRYMDPLCGTMKNEPAEFLKSRWSGVAILVSKAASFVQMERPLSVWSRIRSLVTDHTGTLALILGSSLLGAFLNVAGVFYMRFVIDQVVATGTAGLLWLSTGCAMAAIAVQSFNGWLRSMTGLKLSIAIDRMLISSYYRHLLKLPQSFFDTMRVGEITGRMNDAVKIRTFINETLTNLVVSVPGLLFSLGMILTFSVRLFLTCIFILPCWVVLCWLVYKANREAQHVLFPLSAELNGVFTEQISNIRTIRELSCEEHAKSKTGAVLNNLMRAAFGSGKRVIKTGAWAELFSRASTLILLAYGALLVIHHDISLGVLMAFYALLPGVINPASLFIVAGRGYSEARTAAARLFGIMDLDTDPGFQEEKIPEPGPRQPNAPVIEFQHVGYAYGARPLMLDDINFSIKKGSLVAITGANGSGKSTLFSLLAGNYQPVEGRIVLNGIDLRELKRRDISARIALLGQRPGLFRGSVAENIMIGDKNPDAEQMLRACKLVGADELVRSLPGGYNFVISEHCTNLSGGQKQRLALARAVYRDPDILLLDEPFSHLDREAGESLALVIAHLIEKGKTILVITHGAEAGLGFDQVLRLEKGRLYALRSDPLAAPPSAAHVQK